MYTGSLAPTDFGGAVFTCAHFQKIAQISSLCNFHYISERPLMMSDIRVGMGSKITPKLDVIE